MQRNTSRSRELASTALSQLPVDPERSVLLATAALRITPTKQAEDALRESLVASHVRAAFRSDMDAARAASFTPDGVEEYNTRASAKPELGLEPIDYEGIGRAFREAGPAGLHNGLDAGENRWLFQAVDPDEIIHLVLEGFSNLSRGR